jgi:hypothetical protein
VTSVSFKRCVWCHLVAKLDLVLSPWMHYRVLFYMMWRVTTYSVQIDDRFFFPFFFYLILGKMHDFPSFFSNFNPHSFNFLFRSYSSYVSFFLSQISLSVTISHTFCFFISFLILLIFFFFPLIFFFCFQFYPSIKVFVILFFFNLTLILFFFFC